MNDDNLILLTKVKPWKFLDPDTGEVKQGIKVVYLDKSLLMNDEYNGLGYATFENSVDVSVQIPSVPAIYKPTFVTYMKKGDRCSKLSDLEFVKEVELWN